MSAGDEATRPPRVCVFGTFDERRHPRIRVLVEGLRAHGLEVVVCNVPWRASTAERVAALRRPSRGFRLALRLVRAWSQLWRRSRLVGDVDAVVVGYLGVLDLHLARWWFPGVYLVLDHLAPVGGTVEDRTGGHGSRARLAGAVDAAAVARSDLVLVDTEEHRDGLDAAATAVVPVGASAAWFAAARPSAVRRTGQPLRVVFFGLFTPLQGTCTIAAGLQRALAALPEGGLEAKLIGSGQDEAACRQVLAGQDGVTWCAWVEPRDLPAVVAAADVCLGIFGETPKARRVVPNKVFQGAAAGCAIVTSDTPPQRRALGDAALFVPAGDPEALAAALVRLATEPETLDALRVAACRRARERFAPGEVVRPILGRLPTRAS